MTEAGAAVDPAKALLAEVYAVLKTVVCETHDSREVFELWERVGDFVYPEPPRG